MNGVAEEAKQEVANMKEIKNYIVYISVEVTDSYSILATSKEEAIEMAKEGKGVQLSSDSTSYAKYKAVRDKLK